MNKVVSPQELEVSKTLLQRLLGRSEPVSAKHEKLARWARLLRNNRTMLRRFDQLECYSYSQLGLLDIHGTAFAVAANDPVFIQAGLKYSIHGVMEFFELTKDQLHEFSCNCGDSVPAEFVADTVARLA
jgi:hypothetical protein